MVRLFFATVLACLILLSGGSYTFGQETPAERPMSEQAWTGLFVKDYPDGLLVVGVASGPLDGDGFFGTNIGRGDIVLEINGQKLTQEEYRKLIQQAKPGDEWTIKVRRTGANRVRGTAQPGKESKVEEFKFILERKSDWVGPVDFRPADPQRLAPERVLPEGGEPTKLKAFILEKMKEQKLEPEIGKILFLLRDTQKRRASFNMLSRVAYGFQRPMRLVELQQLITAPMPDVPQNPLSLFDIAAANLDLPAIQRKEQAAADKGVDALGAAMDAAAKGVEKAFEKIPAERRMTLRKELFGAAAYCAGEGDMETEDDTRRLCQALQESMKVDWYALISAADGLAGVALQQTAVLEGVDIEAAPLPEEIKDAVKGSVLMTKKAEAGWMVWGGAGVNEYDMSKLAAVMDAAGDDIYRYPDGATMPAVQMVIDADGNDTYTGGNFGPAAGVLGISLIIDRFNADNKLDIQQKFRHQHASADRYEGKMFSCGAGLMGVGVVMDFGGDDTFVGTKWSQGSAFYGMGAILNLGPGRDFYSGQLFCQGVGGPRGFGLLLDAEGGDAYRAGDVKGTAFSLPGSSNAFSQGVGFGMRNYDTGGIGVLADLDGGDRYEAGEFSQGGAYYWGLGVLYDRKGNDLYRGDQYTQGFSAHQGVGILADEEGNDNYWAQSATNQGGAWDLGMGLLIDRAGHDSYQANGHCQGSAAQLAMGWLIDLDGNDRYIATVPAAQGYGNTNEYHWGESGCHNLGLLIDAGGSEDFYSTGRKNGSVETPGEPNNEKPEKSKLWGLFIDTPEKMELE